MWMSNNGKDTKHTRHITRRINSLRNGEKCKMHKIDWFEGGLNLAYIDTKNIGENDLTPRMKYIMVRVDNWDITLVQEGWQNTEYSIEQEFCMTRLDWVNYSNQSVWNVFRTLKTVCSRREQCCSEWKHCWRKTIYK